MIGTRRSPVRTTFSNTPGTKEREVSSPHYMIRPHRSHGLTEYPTNDNDESEVRKGPDVQTVLNSASEKFGIHFEGQEARVMEDRNGNYIGSSLPIAFN